MQDKEWQGLSRALDRPDFLSDDRFKDAALREVNKDARLDLTQQAIIHMTTEEVISRLEAEDVPCAPVLSRRDMRAHPQVLANEIVMESHHPTAGPLRQARPPARFSETEAALRFGAPRYGEHTKEILAEYGMSDKDIAALEATGAIWQSRGEEAAE